MFRLLFLFDSRRHPVEFPARVFELALRLFLLRAGHLRQGFGEPPAGATQDGDSHIQIALHLFDRRRLGRQWLPLRFQKQFRLGENALANRTGAVPPAGIELAGLPRVATVLHESGGHPLAILHLDARHRHQILHRQLRAQHSFAHLLLDRFRQ
jgi:hypothetical protein